METIKKKLKNQKKSKLLLLRNPKISRKKRNLSTGKSLKDSSNSSGTKSKSEQTTLK